MSQKKVLEHKNPVIKIPNGIIRTGKVLQSISPKLAANFAAKLFITPFKFPIPDREKEMLNNAKIEHLQVTELTKEVVIYCYGNGSKRVLLVHGWSGRGTQMVKIAKKLVSIGYQVISFDAPAHGKSVGKTTMMNEFISTIHAVNKQYGDFEYAIGHSLGGISLLNAVKQGLSLKKLVTIGAGNSIEAICHLFIQNLELKPTVARLMKAKFDKLFGEDIENYSSYIAARAITIPVLVVHDEDDLEIPVSAATEICNELENGTTYITSQLGHRKILGDTYVIKKIMNFLNEKSNENL